MARAHVVLDICTNITVFACVTMPVFFPISLMLAPMLLSGKFVKCFLIMKKIMLLLLMCLKLYTQVTWED